MRVNEIALLLFDYDTAKIKKIDSHYFLLLEKYKRSENEWYRNGKPISFDYTEEKCIASGKSTKELYDSLLKYYHLCQITMEEFLLNEEEQFWLI